MVEKLLYHGLFYKTFVSSSFVFILIGFFHKTITPSSHRVYFNPTNLCLWFPFYLHLSSWKSLHYSFLFRIIKNLLGFLALKKMDQSKLWRKGFMSSYNLLATIQVIRKPRWELKSSSLRQEGKQKPWREEFCSLICFHDLPWLL